VSSSIWTRCAGESELRPLALEPYRVVEDQHQVSTRKLVDTNSEQAVLEELIDAAKPPDPTRGRKHYLLSTPFRYPPLPHGSRFGSRLERGIWYGSETLRPAFAETAYYRLLFLEGTHADLGTIHSPVTVFQVKVRTPRGVDFIAAPFDAHRRTISSKTRYRATQALGAAMRNADVEAFRYWSARDVAGGVNVGVLTPTAFGRSRPRSLASWHCDARRERVEMRKRDYFQRIVYAFPRSEFLVGGKLPLPAP
jgi:hypothetical protein